MAEHQQYLNLVYIHILTKIYFFYFNFSAVENWTKLHIHICLVFSIYICKYFGYNISIPQSVREFKPVDFIFID